MQYSSDYSLFNGAQPQPQPQSHSFTFSSSTVSYGGANGAYYTYSNTRRTGSDGVSSFNDHKVGLFLVSCFLYSRTFVNDVLQLAIEENKEADSASRQATHKISRGLHNKVSVEFFKYKFLLVFRWFSARVCIRSICM